METMTRVSAVRSPVVASQIDGSFDEEDRIYDNLRLIGPDQDKLVALWDALLFYGAAARDVPGHDYRGRGLRPNHAEPISTCGFPQQPDAEPRQV